MKEDEEEAEEQIASAVDHFFFLRRNSETRGLLSVNRDEVEKV